jgi:asparagine synthase (glutamine-hydrolysing)
LICYYAKNKTENEFNTFSMGSDSPIHDESMQAQKYANFLKTTHYTTHMNANNSLEALDGAVASVGEPFGDYSIIPTWQVSKIAKEKVTVALSGDGGDELFFGYDRFRSIGKNHSFWHYPYWIRYGLRGLDKLIFNEKHINECILSSNPGTSHWGLHCRFPYRWLNQIAPNLIHIDAPSLFGVYNYTNPASQEELLYNTRKAEFYGMLQKTLTKVDKASMAHGLEVRVPLLKKSLVEDILRMGIRIHQPMQGRKRILYSLLDKCYPFIPPEKTKKGFSISLSNWLKKNYQKPFRQVLLDQNYCDTFGFDKNAIKSMLVSHNSNHQDLQWPLFSLYSLAIWNKEGRSLV